MGSFKMLRVLVGTVKQWLVAAAKYSRKATREREDLPSSQCEGTVSSWRWELGVPSWWQLPPAGHTASHV